HASDVVQGALLRAIRASVADPPARSARAPGARAAAPHRSPAGFLRPHPPMARRAALALTCVTGFSGLVYAGAWQKDFAALLGSHGEATAAVLALFLGGLSAGYMGPPEARGVR